MPTYRRPVSGTRREKNNACDRGLRARICRKGCVCVDHAKIGRFIAARRRLRGLTQRELAEAMGVSNRTVSKWECGGGLPELANILPLCALLGVTADELLRGGAEE